MSTDFSPRIKKAVLILALLLLLVLAFFAVIKFAEPRRSLRQQITLPVTDEVVIIQPQGEQDVIIVGDPDKIKVTPKKK